MQAGYQFLADEHRPQLALWERLAHAVRVRSPKTAVMGLAGAIFSAVAPRWWRERAPWLAGRLVDVLHLPVRLDRQEFGVLADANATFFSGLLWLERYEMLERHAAQESLDPALPVIELGAAIGVVSCLVNRRLQDPARHICVEANPQVIPVLRRNRERNGCRFEIRHSALAYDGPFVEFGISDDLVASSTQPHNSGGQRVQVPATQLGRLVDDAGFDECTLICDIEGSERDLVDRESGVLQRSVRTIMIEVHPEHLGHEGVTKLHERLGELGFSDIWRRGDVWVLSRRRR